MGVLTFFKGLESSFFLNTRAFTALSRRERDGIVRSLSVPSRSLSGQGQSDTLEKCIISLKEREGLDAKFTSFHLPPPPPLSRRGRDWTRWSTPFPILPFGLRPEAVILDRAVFASLSRGQSNPLRGFSSTIISLETKSEALRLRFLFQRRERDSNPRSCDRLRISRPAHSTTLASLRGLHNIV